MLRAGGNEVMVFRGRTMNRHSKNDFVQELGFHSLGEFNGMIAKVDLASPHKLRAFREWQRRDGTKNGLNRLIITKENVPQSFEDVYKRIYADLPQKLEVLTEYLSNVEIPQHILQMRQQIKRHMLRAKVELPIMLRFYSCILKVFDEELTDRGFKVS